MPGQLIQRGFKWFRERGMVRTAQSAIGYVEDVIFDRIHGLETAEHVHELDIADEHKPHCQSYQPTRVRHFRKLMHSLKLPRNHVFVDVGCGKGRMLVAAAQYGFRRVMGVEISPRLSAIACRNVASFRQRRGSNHDVEVVCSNISDFALRHDESVFYLFWPFDKLIMETFLMKVRASLRASPRDMWIIINNPKYPEVFTGECFRHHHRFLYGGSTFEIYRHHHL